MSEETKTTQNYEFKAEVKQLLNILVHSLYTNRDIFLRELISNSSDALDKLRFESNKGTEIIDKDLPLEINVKFDAKENTITIRDTGIGMSKDEIIKNIGTIAKSGTSEFLEQLAKNKESASNLIGKFGVGFYSVFMVADKVVLKSKSYKKDEKAVRWESDGLGTYEMEETGGVIRGTTIEIHLKEDAKELAEEYRLESIIKKHSNFINFPIYLSEKRVNTVSAIWREPKSSIKKEQYTEFYKFLTYDSEEPFEIIHKSVDAPIQFSALLFIPKKNFDMFGFSRENYGLDLYVRRVLIQHQNKDMLPEYLSFVKGVVDSEDLPLNISRETLQENLIFTKIANSVTSQVLSHLSKLAEDDPQRYTEFWNEHGKVFRLGYSDFTNLEKYQELIRFNSSKVDSVKDLVSFADYTSRMKESQKEIYYVFGQSRGAIESDPHLEIFKSKGVEVLYLFDPVEELVMSSIRKYKDYELKSVDQVDLSKIDKLETVDEKKTDVEEISKEDSKAMKGFVDRVKEILGDRVKDVKISKRLKDSPAVLVNPDDTTSSTMQKIMHITNQDKSIPKKIFEINQDHKMIRNLLTAYKSDANDEYVKNVIEQLYESYLMLDGYLDDPHMMVKRINKLM
ncbi:MAG: molecular chaperone HtpG, partial [Melioribacteraceae bacterium]|nr:molecular chaperone HtpG [Melioribacteraceae bacterium]